MLEFAPLKRHPKNFHENLFNIASKIALITDGSRGIGEPIDKYSESDWDKVMNINLKGPFSSRKKATLTPQSGHA